MSKQLTTEEFFNLWIEEDATRKAKCIDAKFRMLAFAESYHQAKLKEQPKEVEPIKEVTYKRKPDLVGGVLKDLIKSQKEIHDAPDAQLYRPDLNIPAKIDLLYDLVRGEKGKIGCVD